MLVYVSVQQIVHMTGGGYGWYGFPRLAAHRYKTTLYWRPYRSTAIAQQAASYPAASHGVWLVSTLASPNSLRSP